MGRKPVPKKVIIGKHGTYEWFNNKYSPKSKKATGFYDSKGNRFDGVIIKPKEHESFECHCNFCNKTSLVWYEDGKDYFCPKCGAKFEVAIEKEKNLNKLLIPFAAVILVAALGTGGYFLFKNGIHLPNSKPNNEHVINNNIGFTSLYKITDWAYRFNGEAADEGKLLDTKEDGSFFDRETKVHIKKDESDRKNPWRYYWEDISPNYPNGGWMMFDEDKLVWFVQNSLGNWEELPYNLVLDYMWYIVNDYDDEADFTAWYIYEFEKKVHNGYDNYLCNSIDKASKLELWVNRIDKELSENRTLDSALEASEGMLSFEELQDEYFILSSRAGECSREFDKYSTIDGISIPEMPFGYTISIFENGGGRFVMDYLNVYEIYDSYQAVGDKPWRAWGSYDFLFSEYDIPENWYKDPIDSKKKTLLVKQGSTLDGWEENCEENICRYTPIWK